MTNALFLTSLAIPFLATMSLPAEAPDPLDRARAHPIERDWPGVGFFEGALLGNGGLGAVITTRPDAIVVYFGHNDVWDIRIAEAHQDEIGTFEEVFEKVKAIPKDYPSLEKDPWYSKYMKMTRDNYSKPYPRPFPCGALLLGFDRREAEMLGYSVDISTGLCRIRMLARGVPVDCQLFVDMASDSLWVRLVDAGGSPVPNLFNRVRLIPDPQTPQDLPHHEVLGDLPPNVLAFRQVLPFQEPRDGKSPVGHPKDRAFRLSLVSALALESRDALDPEGRPKLMRPLERAFVGDGPFLVRVCLDQGPASEIGPTVGALPPVELGAFASALAATQQAWEGYWNCSSVALEDAFLERIWYWNHYFFNCATKPGVNCPGLFANWSFGNIGTAWHGDYHMNYNTQQPFWLPFSSNRVEKNLAYVELVERLLPMSKKWAKEYYGLRGAYFPHSAYPVEMNMSPYPVPTWGWEICETPWTVQGLWWHYAYTMDKSFLRDRAFEPIREAVLFLVDYMRRPEARGPQWGDDKYHIFPTVPPELYGLMPGFRYNNDCLVDLTLTKFVMQAYLEAVDTLGLAKSESDLMRDVTDILDHFPEYPTAESKFGEVFVSVPGEHSEVVYNVPNSLMTVFPGEDHGLHSPKGTLEILTNSFRNNQNEGGNDLVFLNLQAARLGMLDLDRFARQVRYCMMPNGTCTDMVLQVHGRYDDATPYDFMSEMGVWFENFSLPVVINECLMQSYSGTIRLFPNWPKDRSAAFRTLRARGAFLVSAATSKEGVRWVDIASEAGAPLRIVIPWETGARVISGGKEQFCGNDVLEMPTEKGQTIRLRPVEAKAAKR